MVEAVRVELGQTQLLTAGYPKCSRSRTIRARFSDAYRHLDDQGVAEDLNITETVVMPSWVLRLTSNVA